MDVMSIGARGARIGVAESGPGRAHRREPKASRPESDARDVEQGIVDGGSASVKIVAEDAPCLIEVFGGQSVVGTQASSHEPEKPVLREFIEDFCERGFGVESASESGESLGDDEGEGLIFEGASLEVSEDEFVGGFGELRGEEFAESESGACVCGVCGECVDEIFGDAWGRDGESFSLGASFGFAHGHPVDVSWEGFSAEDVSDLRDPCGGGGIGKMGQDFCGDLGDGVEEALTGCCLDAAEEEDIFLDIDEVDAEQDTGFVVDDAASEGDIAADGARGG